MDISLASAVRHCQEERYFFQVYTDWGGGLGGCEGCLERGSSLPGSSRLRMVWWISSRNADGVRMKMNCFFIPVGRIHGLAFLSRVIIRSSSV